MWKRKSEQYLADSGIPYTIIRYFFVDFAVRWDEMHGIRKLFLGVSEGNAITSILKMFVYIVSMLFIHWFS